MVTCIVILALAVLITAVCMALMAVRLAHLEKSRTADKELARQKKEFQEILAREEKQFQALMNYKGGLNETQE